MLSSVRNYARRGATLAGAAVVSGGSLAFASDDHIPALNPGWSHNGAFSSYDYKSVRRGFQVYKEVCATCHSVEGIAFRNLVNVIFSEKQAKKLAESYEIEDGPNDEGEMFERPGKLSDYIPGPYANEEAGRAANGGALPPDLTLITKARPNGTNYVFSLLTGYVDPPEGKAMLPGLHYNPYFAGGAIAMPAPLTDGAVEYEDGTEATASQMAKDVSTFLAWCAEPEADDRKKNGVRIIGALTVAFLLTGFYKRFRYSPLKTRQISYVK
uniref:Cytochrome c domain-containing protein n=1 Tax=Phaeomonas parva TaxID=124430 RepID=A0A7S1TQH4_9STRA|mmetsp:Transcript_113/g.389  ORF Transcript_113/g.389 Transcript_113/m.389 type:complete len:269 (+) Transcript_113:173-979(+)